MEHFYHFRLTLYGSARLHSLMYDVVLVPNWHTRIMLPTCDYGRGPRSRSRGTVRLDSGLPASRS